MKKEFTIKNRSKIIYVDFEMLSNYCIQLSTKIQNSGFKPDLIISVERAGVLIGEHINKFIGSKHFLISAKRTGQLTKQKLSSFIKIIPLPLRELLKKIENNSGIHSYLKNRTVEFKFNYDLNGKKVLIVDDAVDSGNSLMNIIDKLNKSYPEILEIKSAVITVTKQNPVIFPDFYIFNNNSILTFPWTEDSPFNLEFIKRYKSFYGN